VTRICPFEWRRRKQPPRSPQTSRVAVVARRAPRGASVRRIDRAVLATRMRDINLELPKRVAHVTLKRPPSETLERLERNHCTSSQCEPDEVRPATNHRHPLRRARDGVQAPTEAEDPVANALPGLVQQAYWRRPGSPSLASLDPLDPKTLTRWAPPLPVRPFVGLYRSFRLGVRLLL
jgi:hypothetical protein